MSFWNKVKDFVGIEDNYDDEDYQDYEESKYDNDTVQNVIDENKVTFETSKEDKARKFSTYRSYSTSSDNYKESDSMNMRTKYNSSNDDMVVTIKEPLKYEDGKQIIDDVKQGKTVVLNLEMLEVDNKTQIFYFVSGGVYALEGSIQNVTKDIYVLVPDGVKVDGKLKDKLSEKSIYQI